MCIAWSLEPEEAKKGLWIPLELELQMIMSHHMVTGWATMWVQEIKPRSSQRAASTANYWAFSPGHYLRP